MGYQALYRKLRPKNFNQVIGQEHIVKTLKNQVDAKRISHAYLFCGTRGTGKTSIAKIFAKLINCEAPKDLAPCDKCEMCRNFDENRSLNVIEIDAASNNGVDDIREIREEVKYPPTKGRYKVYIIDEVHMLSIGAFNALLKTLEEPPSYVVFILATTDPQKIPVTILSRCQRFDFKRIGSEQIFGYIKKYMQDENAEIEEAAIRYIAKISDGAMRDALSLLDQCISFYFGEKITLAKVMEITNSVDDEITFLLAEALISFDAKSCITIIDEVISQGRDISQFNSDLILHFRNLLVSSVSKDNLDLIDLSLEKIESLKKQAERTNLDDIMKFIKAFSEIQYLLKQSFNNRIIFETCCIKLCNFTGTDDLSDVFKKIEILEKQIEESKKNVVYFDKPSFELENEEEEKPKRELAIQEDFKNAIENWALVLKKFDAVKRQALEMCYPSNLEDKLLYVVCKKEIDFKIVSKIKEDIEKVLAESFGKEYKVLVIMENEFRYKHDQVATSEKKMSEEEIREDISEKFNFSGLDIE